MSRFVPRNLAFRLALVAAALVLQEGCRQDQTVISRPDQPITTWNSARMLEVKQEWQTLSDSFKASWSKTNFGERTTMLHGVLKRRLSHQDMIDLAATCGTLSVDENDWSDFERCVIEEMVDNFATSRDRKNLVTLLSTRCPSYYGAMKIEGHLINIGEKKLKDPVLILGEAYSRCQAPQVRKVIAQAIRRGLKGFGIWGNDDADFVRRSMTWYEQEKAQLVFNRDYPTTIDALDLHSYWKRPLFKWRSPSGTKRTGPQAFQSKDKASAPARQPESLKKVTNSIGMQMILMPPGDFMMGAPDDEKGHRENEFPQHPVRITKAFWLGVYEVTQTEYEQMMSDLESGSHRFGVNRHGNGKVDTGRFPVDDIPWYQAIEFCNHLSRKEGFPAFYRLASSKRGKPWKDVSVLGGSGYRLPTEAEWEFACRAGTTGPFSFGGAIKENEANLNKKTAGRAYGSSAAAVGSYQANAFGLYDMHGNVAEWCNDGYDPRYYEDCVIDDPPGPSADDPTETSSTGFVVARGGSWYSSPETARAAFRQDEMPWVRSRGTGFRVARSDSKD